VSKYRCYLLDDQGCIIDRQYIEGEDDDAAFAQAGVILAENGFAAAMEVWIDAYLVQKLRKLVT
jgi:hypothetical protein